MSFVEIEDWEALAEKIWHWKSIAEKFILQNKHREVETIQQAFRDVWAIVEGKRQFMDDDDSILIEIIEEYLRSFCK